MSLEGLNRALGGFLRGQVERRSLWLKGFLALLAVLVLLNLAGIKPHEAAGPAHDEKATHGETGPGDESAHGAPSRVTPAPSTPAGSSGTETGAPDAVRSEGEEGRGAVPQPGAAGQGDSRPGEPVAGGAAPVPHGEGRQGDGAHAEAAGAPEPMAREDGVALNYYPQGSHTYQLTGWVSGSGAGRAVIEAFHYLHSAEAFPGFWALFGVLVAVVLVRLSKGAAHTFLGKEEDFYD